MERPVPAPLTVGADVGAYARVRRAHARQSTHARALPHPRRRAATGGGRTRRGVHVVRADAHRLPFADGSFDAVLAGVSVFRYLDYSRALAECARVLAPGGLVSLHVQASAAWSPRHLLRRRRAGDDALDARRLDELGAPAAAAGLIEERVRTWRSIRWGPTSCRCPSSSRCHRRCGTTRSSPCAGKQRSRVPRRSRATG